MRTTMYHVTLRSNLNSIIINGLSPEYSKCRYPSVYLVDEKRLHWAMFHVMNRHGVTPKALLICAVVVDRSSLVKTHMVGVYRSNETIRPGWITVYKDHVSPDLDET